MFLGQLEPGTAVELMNAHWFSLEECMRIARVDKAHMGIIQLTRWYPIMSDKELQKVWKGYIEKKNECEQNEKRLQDLGILLEGEIPQLSLGLRFLSLCPSLIINQLQHCCPATQEACQEIEVFNHFQLLEEVKSHRQCFFRERNDVYLMAPVGGREKYAQIPGFQMDIGVFEESLTLCKDRYSKELKEVNVLYEKRNHYSLENDRSLFLFAVSIELCRRASVEAFKDMRSPLTPFFEAASDIVSQALEQLKGIEIGTMSPETVVFILSIACQTAPVMHYPQRSLGWPDDGGPYIPFGYAISIRNTTTNKITTSTIGRDSRWTGDWLMSNINGPFNTSSERLFTDNGERTERYNQLSELLIKRQLTTEEGTFIVEVPQRVRREPPKTKA